MSVNAFAALLEAFFNVFLLLTHTQTRRHCLPLLHMHAQGSKCSTGHL